MLLSFNQIIINNLSSKRDEFQNKTCSRIYMYLYTRVVGFAKSRMEVTIVNLYSSYYYSIPFLVINGSLHVRRGTRTRKSACGNEEHACNSQWPRGGESKRRTKRERREEEREKEYRVTRLVISCAKKICLLNIYARWIRYGIGNVASLSGKRNRRKVYRILVETAPRGN